MVVDQATTSTTASALFEAHMQAELNGDLDATMATMVANPQLIGQFFPPDVEFIPISRTEDGERLVDSW